MPREDSLGALAILSDKPLVIEAVDADERTQGRRKIGDNRIGAYLGIPIIGSDGFALGAISVIDTRARTFNETHLAALSSIARQIAQLLSNRAAQQRLQNAVRLMTEGIIIHDSSETLVQCNPAAAEILGMSQDMLVGTTVRSPIFRTVREDGLIMDADERPTRKALQTGEPQRNVLIGFERPELPILWILTSAIPVFEPGAKRPAYCVTTFTNMSEWKSQSEGFIQRARMVAVGEMAAGVAHEINNPLAVIVGHGSYLEHLINKGEWTAEEMRDRIGKITQSALRASRVVAGLLTFARDSRADDNQPVSLRHLIEESLAFATERFRMAQISLQCSSVPDIEIRGNFSELSQVLVNLLNNAYDAVKTTDSKNVRLDFVDKKESVTPTIAIAVSDSGDGVPEAIRARIMEPFFTTKGVGRGTGLGLSISKGIIERHGGKLYLDCAHKGARFVMELPIARIPKRG